MAPHSFLFHPTKEDLHHYIAAIEKVEDQDKFRGQVAVDIQYHTGTWVGEFSTLTSRKMMEFIAEIYMELPPEEELEDFDLVSDGPADAEADPIAPEAYEKLYEAVMSDGTPEFTSDEEDDEYEQTDEEYEHEEGTPAQTTGQVRPKKLKKPAAVARTGNPAITVEED